MKENYKENNEMFYMFWERKIQHFEKKHSKPESKVNVTGVEVRFAFSQDREIAKENCEVKVQTISYELNPS